MHDRLNKIITLLKKIVAATKKAARKLSQVTTKLLVASWQLLQKACLFTWQQLKNVFLIIAYGFLAVGQVLHQFTKACLQSITVKWPAISARLDEYILLTRLNKPIGILLLLWPTLWALWIAAGGVPDHYVLLVFVLGVILMRSAGCVINDIADRKLDLHVSRTRDRPITSGRVSVSEALALAAALVLIAFLLVLTLNSLTIKLSVIALLLALIYPFMKRYTYLPQLFLGLAFAWSIPMAFAAITNSVPIVTWLLLLATVLWTMVYDTLYAMVDRKDDIKIGIKSTAVLFADADRFIIGIIQILALFSLLFVGSHADLGKFYYAGLGVAALFSIYQQYLIKDRIPEHCFRAFLNNNWFGATVFAGISLHYMSSIA